MSLQYPLVDIKDVPVAMAVEKDGRAIAVIRCPIGAAQGSSTVAFHATQPPGAAQPKHLHTNSDEIGIYLKGSGVAIQDGAATPVRPGHCYLAPKGTAHSFVNQGDEEALIVGFQIGAADLEATGFEYLGEVGPEDLARPAANGGGDGGNGGAVLVHLDDVAPENMATGDGWSITDFRLPIAGHNGSSSTLFRARFFPGAIHKKHRHDNCEEIYYIISGHGLAGAGADRVEVRGGQFHYIPAGVEHWLHNLSETDPIEVVGIYIGAGSVAATGYVYMGEVTADDIAARS